MATLLLSTAGAQIGAAVAPTGYAALGVSLGRAVGAVAGSFIDQAILGPGARSVEGPRLARIHLQTAAEGAALPRVWGRMRIGASVIWATHFKETRTTTTTRSSSGGGKGGGGASSSQTTRVTEYRYTVSLALGLCEGPIDRIGRIWADGQEIPISDFHHRLYTGAEDQGPDSLISAVEGAENAPAYRGVAYLVLEDLPLERFGDRVPQFSVEVFRRPPPQSTATTPPLEDLVAAVALGPGTGAFTLAAQPVRRVIGEGRYASENTHDVSGRADLLRSLDQLQETTPNLRTVALLYSWFGDDLRCGRCSIRPGVEDHDLQTTPLTWRIGGLGPADAHLISRTAEGRANYGSTPADVAVIQAIQEIRRRGLEVALYPFLLMDAPAGGGKPDPWSEDPLNPTEQPAFPWRGRITCDPAPGRAGSPDRSVAAAEQTDAFFGVAQRAEFSVSNGLVSYSGPANWGYRRFVLHAAHLASAAGGVDLFAIGSEMRSLTQVRSAAGAYPAVAQLQSLASDVRAVLGAGVKLTYAADWSEYFGHQPQDGSGDVYFHLDPLWADPAIDGVGVDAYFPLADARDDLSSLYDVDALRSQIEGGEGFDWHYADANARSAGTRSPIVDGAYGEDWIFRPKDLRAWWASPHHNRPGGVRAPTPTAWVPQSKPIWLTEIGCPAVDHGANQPNVFYDPKSTESALPHFSRGVRDDFGQRRYLEAALSYWAGPANPISDVYAAPMIDRAPTVWTWDARPWPDFPNRTNVWSDGPNHGLGHWVTGRLGGAPLGDVVAEICRRSGLRTEEYDVSRLAGVVEGMRAEDVLDARGLLQPLMLIFAFDAVDVGGVIRFIPRGGGVRTRLTEADLVAPEEDGAQSAVSEDAPAALTLIRGAAADAPTATRLSFALSASDYRPAAVEARLGGGSAREADRIALSEAPLALSSAEAQRVVDRWLSEAHVARDGARFAVPRDRYDLEPGDVVAIETESGDIDFRISRIADGDAREIEAVRVEAGLYALHPTPERQIPPPAAPLHAPPEVVFLDLPLLTGDEPPHAPRIAGFVDPWPGALAVHRSADGESYDYDLELPSPATIGRTLTPLAAAAPHRWSRQAPLRVRLSGGAFESREPGAVLNGANILALESSAGAWEVLQFQNAELVEPDVYDLSGLLRGQGGTEHLVGAPTPVGARVALLDAAIGVSTLPEGARGLPRRYRIGPADRPIDPDLFTEITHTASAVGLRPYAPAHLRAARQIDGGLKISWIRRSRIGGDSWEGADPPLGEERERYRVRVVAEGAEALRRDAETSSLEIAAADLPSAPFEITVAQLSDPFGPGPETRLAISQ